VFFGLIPLIQVYAISTTFRLIIDYFNQLKTQHKLEEENRASELSFLRSQINPHFLFNTLNNINALIRLKPTEAEKSIGVLSNLMRYILNSGTLEKIELKKEIDYLNNFIELQKLRLPKNFNLNFNCSIENENATIEPLLLIGFIENTFKHGVSGSDDDFIDINIQCKNNQLTLLTTNKIHQLGNIEHIASGVGLKNTQKRLELCYQNNYQLNLFEENGNYKIKLQINL
jgi:LytS/YehU family sensor histidine kinase